MRRWSCDLSLWILILLLSVAVNVHATSNQGRDQSHQAKADKHQRSTENQQAITAIADPLRALISEEVAKQRQEHADHEDWNTIPFWLMFGLNAALVLVGGTYTVVAYCQLRALGRGLVETAKAADAAKQSADDSRRQMHLELRSYIYISKAELVNPSGDKPTIAYTIRNAGKIPAIIIGLCEVTNITTKMPASVQYSGTIRKGFPVAPNDTRGNPVELAIHPFSPDEFAKIDAGDQQFFFYGQILYRDFLNEEGGPIAPYITYFGFRTTSTDIPLSSEPQRIELSFMDEPFYNRFY